MTDQPRIAGVHSQRGVADKTIVKVNPCNKMTKTSPTYQRKMATRNLSKIVSIYVFCHGTRNHCKLNDSRDKTHGGHSEGDQIHLIRVDGGIFHEEFSVGHRQCGQVLRVIKMMIQCSDISRAPSGSHHDGRCKPPPFEYRNINVSFNDSTKIFDY